jgi:hypothetical protein
MKPSQTKAPQETSVFSATIPINYSIAIDPIKYIRIPFSFHYFKPHSNIVNNNRMPGEPSLPPRSVLGSYFHLRILSFGSWMKCTEEPRVWVYRDQIVSWISVVPTSRCRAANMIVRDRSAASRLRLPRRFGEATRHTARSDCRLEGARSTIKCQPQCAPALHCVTVSVVPRPY